MWASTFPVMCWRAVRWAFPVRGCLCRGASGWTERERRDRNERAGPDPGGHGSGDGLARLPPGAPGGLFLGRVPILEGRFPGKNVNSAQEFGEKASF